MQNNMNNEIERIKKVSDMLCTMHAVLRDRLYRKAITLDLCILGSSTWLVALVFIEPRIGTKLAPLQIESYLWLGILTIITFFLSIVQVKVNWKERADAHNRSCNLYASVKKEAGYLLVQKQDISHDNFRRVIDIYDTASGNSIAIPEKSFLKLKQNHRLKINISRHLDNHPSCNIYILRVRWWLRDNWNSLSQKDN